MAGTWGEIMAGYLSDLGAETAKDFYGDEYVTIPTGGTGEAIEIEKLGKFIYVIYLRTWDRTNGLADERYIFESQSVPSIHAEVRELFASVKADLDKFEAMMAGGDDER